MLSNTFDRHVRFGQIFWFGLVAVACVFLSLLLAWAPWMIMFVAGFVAWLITLPYHARIATYLSVATFSSALLLPYLPGRPYMWEFAGLLAWTGLAVVISLRRYRPESVELIRRHRLMLIGLMGYIIVLMITMFYRGVGFRVLGSEVMGGRYYFQQYVCSIFPFLFIMVPLEEKTAVRLFTIQCLLTTTYLVSDFVFSFAPQGMIFLLRFFELPGDAINFEGHARSMGIRRFQSLYVVSTGVLYLLLVRFKLNDFFSLRGIFLLPLALGMFAIGLLSGHRFIVFIITTVTFQVALTQRFITLKNGMIGVGLLLVGLLVAYGFADRMPLAAQRALSVLPGIKVQSDARADALGTLDSRRLLRQIGWRMIPDYAWMGRGFSQAGADYSMTWDNTGITYHLSQGRFFNGFIGLMVNMGAIGTFFMMLFMGFGTALAIRLLRRVHDRNYDDMFARVTTLLASLWVANVFSFMFLHGDSEYAVKTFSLQAGLLITCDYLMRKREEIGVEVVPAEIEESVTT